MVQRPLGFLLHDVLYAPTVGHTLISVGRLDSQGYQASFGEGKLVLMNPDSDRISLILKSDRGLYQVLKTWLHKLAASGS